MVGEREYQVLTFGPLCVAPEYQGRGVGGLLLDETLALAKAAGESGVIIFGEPDYYPRHGFVTCDRFGITTPDGENFDAFIACKLSDSFDEVHGKFYEAEVFEQLDGCEEFDLNFPPMEARKFPRQF